MIINIKKFLSLVKKKKKEEEKDPPSIYIKS